MKRRTYQRPELRIEQILVWADIFHDRMGRWPKRNDGRRCLRDTNWSAIDQCLRVGLRGLNPGSSLAKLLLAQRGRRHKGLLPRLTLVGILNWADKYFKRTGDWPDQYEGRVIDAPGETWGAINAALDVGGRGLPGGSSLAQLLNLKRGVRNHLTLPRLTHAQVLAWADAHHTRTTEWPDRESGAIIEAPGEIWAAIHKSLAAGQRGLPVGSSLARLLAEHRGVRNPAALPRLEIWELLAYADSHFARTGRWPNADSGPILESPGESWSIVDTALREGTRGLPGNDSLARLLERGRGVRNHKGLPSLTVEQILGWSDAYHARCGQWPRHDSGTIIEAPSETWLKVETALREGGRGLAGGSSLVRLLEVERGVRNYLNPPRLIKKKVLEWADEHHKKTGKWPSITAGPIDGAPGETWSAVNSALHVGRRGFAGGSSLARLLAKYRSVRNHMDVPRLTAEQVLGWADNHNVRTGRWPNRGDGPIVDAVGENWGAVNGALIVGVRGFPGGDSLACFLERHRGARNAANLPTFTIDKIRNWVNAHHRRTGKWPRRDTGLIPEATGETWSVVYHALHRGLRGLPAGESLTRIIRECQESVSSLA